MFADPEKLRDREIRESRIAGKLNEEFGAKFLGKVAALLFASNVAPDQSGPDHAVLVIQHDRSVHLAGKTNASNVVSAQVGIGQRLRNRNSGSAPPVGGILLGPSNMRRGKRGMLFRGRA
ncbi:MAG TPA: hypothetical protein VF780_01670 [Nitrosospira sp.]